VNVDIPNFVRLIREGKTIEAALKIKERNILPSVCGRVCPQEDQCEKGCVLGKRDKPVAIGNLERYVADFERAMGPVEVPPIKECMDRKVAVVGSGPGGLTCAADLTRYGYEVTIFEAFHQPGGVLGYGIPQFRLPKEIMVKEIEYLKELGCQIKLNSVIGKLFTIDELLKDFDAIYIGVGAGLPKFLDVPGEDLNNVVSANEYLTRINLMKAYRFPDTDTPLPQGDRIAVIGGGNVAMDSARCALRTGAKKVTVIYRRTREELPARKDEVVHAEDEGIEFMYLTNPIRFIGDKRNWVRGIECEKMVLGEADASGRRKPVPISGSNFVFDCDVVIVAVGTDANPLIFDTTPDIKRDKNGYIAVDPRTMETSKEFVFAGGDIVTGSATVIQAMGAGRLAAKAIHEKLSNNKGAK
jgi:glutamate synthase (NADPH/NADH) small chain